MTCTSIVYNNKISNLDTFITDILCFDVKSERVPISEIEECSNHYLITLKPFYQKYYFFEVYYKNSFLIIQIKRKNSPSKILSTRLFYLPNINTNKLSHNYYNDSLSLKIPKIYCK